MGLLYLKRTSVSQGIIYGAAVSQGIIYGAAVSQENFCISADIIWN